MKYEVKRTLAGNENNVHMNDIVEIWQNGVPQNNELDVLIGQIADIKI
jgi:hypothetical protein